MSSVDRCDVKQRNASCCLPLACREALPSSDRARLCECCIAPQVHRHLASVALPSVLLSTETRTDPSGGCQGNDVQTNSSKPPFHYPRSIYSPKTPPTAKDVPVSWSIRRRNSVRGQLWCTRLYQRTFCIHRWRDLVRRFILYTVFSAG
jgi:hypothetical protein